MTDVSQDAREAVLENLRDRKLLKYLFDEEPDNCVAYGYVDAPIDLETQHEIADTLVSIVEAHIRSTIADRDSEAMRLERALEKALDGLDSIAGDRTPEFFPESSYDMARRVAREARALAAIDTLTSAAQDGVS